MSVPSCDGSDPGTTGPVGKTCHRSRGKLRCYGGSGNLVCGVLHRRFHELEGQEWRPQLVVPADRRGIIIQRFHGGAIGAHLGTARTLVLAEQGFYWPGMRADMSRICTECDCAMLKERRGQREPLHQYVFGVPMERLGMDVAGPYPITSTGNQYCLMVGCYFWLECFPILDQKATTIASVTTSGWLQGAKPLGPVLGPLTSFPSV